ncbi:MAG TPA: YggT family protein [Candidatus Dojkabacteria bacterium]|nr:YggT family protein [Candidatus Dojkabacteria bacterium]
MYVKNVPSFIGAMVDFVFGLVVLGLGLRFLFRLFGANPNADFTKFLYNSTATLLEPFRNIFTPYVVDKGYVFEFSTLIAIVIYSLVAWLLVEFVMSIQAWVNSMSSKK